MKKPEILVPVGNSESFYAALNGGADALFLGLQSFNARGRASNFTPEQLQLIIKRTHEKGVKVYVTLNILIKNQELRKLLDTLAFLDAIRVDAVIIQDWGVYYLIKRYFPKLRVHASTQMGNHNSVGVNFGTQKGISRTVLARELTMTELAEIRHKSKAELEVFVHGALCYSFSGMCLFSSYLGGQGANRGLCKQSCRRIYHNAENEAYLFSLKDNQQLKNLAELAQLGIDSLKIEGRMKSADYVSQVCRAYRLALDRPDKMEEAARMLELDMGREKTSYFLGREVHDAITTDPSTGIRIGQIKAVGKNEIRVNSFLELKDGYRLRIRNLSATEPVYVTIENVRKAAGCEYLLKTGAKGISVGDDVLLVRLNQQSFPSRLGNVQQVQAPRLRKPDWALVQKELQVKPDPASMLLARIDSPEWFGKIRFEDFDVVILSFSRSAWQKIDFSASVFQDNKAKIRIEFPGFIPEGKLFFYQELAQKAVANGLSDFSLSHLSQRLILPAGSRVGTNERVYVLNDATARMLADEGISDFTYPLENELENLQAMSNRNGIIPMYFYPELFYSRMPVPKKVTTSWLIDENNKKYAVKRKDGLTVVTPAMPVCLFQYRQQLEKLGYRKFLLDFSGEQISVNTLKRLLKKFRNNEQVNPSTVFNFRQGLK